MTGEEATKIVHHLAGCFPMRPGVVNMILGRMAHWPFEETMAKVTRFIERSARWSYPEFLAEVEPPIQPRPDYRPQTVAAWIRRETGRTGPDAAIILAHYAECWQATQRAPATAEAIAQVRSGIYGHARAAFIESGISPDEASELAAGVVGWERPPADHRPPPDSAASQIVDGVNALLSPENHFRDGAEMVTRPTTPDVEVDW